MIHAHLRGPQIALFIHFFQGRLAEVFGPVAKRLDHALRILDYGAAVPEIERTLPDETRQCCEAFLDGINSYNERITELPPEFGVLGLKPGRHTMATLLAGSRLASTDFTWITFMSLLPRRARPGFTRLWNRTIEAGESPTPGAHAEALRECWRICWSVPAARGQFVRRGTAAERHRGGAPCQRPASRPVPAVALAAGRAALALIPRRGLHDPGAAGDHAGAQS